MKKNTNAKNKKNKKKRAFFRILLIIILIPIIVFGGWFGYNYVKHKMTGADYDPLSAAALGIDPEKLKNVGRINVLILGESGVGDGYKLTDSIMLVSYNPQTQKASILSIPRDTYVGKRDRQSAPANYLASYKMNAVYRNGENLEETVERVSELTGVDIDYYVLIDTDAIIEIVDAIGGTNFDVPIDMDYDDPTQDLHIHLKAGMQKIDGKKAEQLLRFRHNNDGTTYPQEYGDNDLGRMRTQREFIKETLKQLVRFENVTKFLNVLNIVFDNINTDMKMETIKYYVPYAFKFNMENIVSETVPGVPEQCNGIWLYVANKKETKEITERLFTDKVEEDELESLDTNTIANTTTNITTNETSNDKTNKVSESKDTSDSKKEIKIELLNGTGSDDTLEELSKKLTKAGYTVSKTGKTSATFNSVIINRTMQSKSVEQELKDMLNVKTSYNSSNNSKVDFTIIIGKDYK